MKVNFIRVHLRDDLFKGVYRYCQGIQRDDSASDDDPRSHPWPEDDKLLIRNLGIAKYSFHGAHYYYGFSSYKQLKEWFFDNNHLEMMKEKGMVVSVMYIPKEFYSRGYTQAVVDKKFFDDEYSKSTEKYLLKTLEIDSLYNEKLFNSHLT